MDVCGRVGAARSRVMSEMDTTCTLNHVLCFFDAVCSDIRSADILSVVRLSVCTDAVPTPSSCCDCHDCSLQVDHTRSLQFIQLFHSLITFILVYWLIALFATEKKTVNNDQSIFESMHQVYRTIKP